MNPEKVTIFELQDRYQVRIVSLASLHARSTSFNIFISNQKGAMIQTIGIVQFGKWKMPYNSTPNDFPLEDTDLISNKLNIWMSEKHPSLVSIPRELLEKIIKFVIVEGILTA